MESETNVFGKFNSLMAQMQQHSQLEAGKMSAAVESSIKQTTEKVSKNDAENLKDFRKFMEGATQQQQDRFQDMYSMISSVLEQACGAKNKADECSHTIAMLNERLICQD